MSRKHFELVARIFANRIRYSRSVPLTEDEVRLLKGLALDFASEFIQDNPRFDRDRFMQACGFVQED